MSPRKIPATAGSHGATLTRRSPKPQELTALVLDVLRGRPRAEQFGLSSDEVVRAVEAFVTAGSRALAEGLGREKWRTWGLPLKLSMGTSKRTRETVASLRRLLSACRADKAVSTCFFMRKPPGVRFRVESTAPHRVERIVGRWMERESVTAITLPYEPEEYQFGGPTGMAIAHRHFTYDSAAALDVHHRASAGKLSVEPWALSLLCIVDLAQKVTGDEWEVWDLWSNLRLAGRLGEAADREELRALAEQIEPFVRSRREMTKLLPTPEREIVQHYLRANSAVARELVRAHRAGDLLYPPRQVVPFWIVFHWNRWGFEEREQLTLAHGVEYVLNPKRPISE